MSTSVVGTIASGAGKVGSYFTVVSALPATVFMTYVYVLVEVAWSGPVRWSALAEAPWYGILLAGLAAFTLALALNPLQFHLIQLFEGYWGTSTLGVELAKLRVLRHRRRYFEHEAASTAAEEEVAQAGVATLDVAGAPPRLIRAAIAGAASRRAAEAYPEAADILPTRLGNVLRTYERSVGDAYGIDPLIAVPRLAMVAGDREVAYVQNQRTQLELALRTSLMGLLATAVTLAVMSRHGLWLLLALVPYAVAYLSYRGAVALAHEYGGSLAVLIDLSRMELYRRMGLPQPKSTEAERAMNTKLMRIFAADTAASLPYDPQPPPQAAVPIQITVARQEEE